MATEGEMSETTQPRWYFVLSVVMPALTALLTAPYIYRGVRSVVGDGLGQALGLLAALTFLALAAWAQRYLYTHRPPSEPATTEFRKHGPRRP